MQVLLPHVSCVVQPGEFAAAKEAGFKEIYAITSKGVIKHHQLRTQNGVERFVRLKVDKIPGYEEVEIKEGVQFLPAGKIPYALYEQVLGFFRKVMSVNEKALEAMIHVLYNPERGYHLGVPPQRISQASVSYDWSYIPDGTSIVVDIHSHNTMGAFFSGTDNADDRNNISFSGVFGKLNEKEPATVWRFNYYDKKFEAKADMIFELPEIPQVEVPQEWMDNVQISTPRVYGKGGNSNLGNVGTAYEGYGRSWDHLQQYKNQAGRRTGIASTSPAARQSGTGSAANANSHMYGDAWPDAGFQSSFFDHADDRPQTPEEAMDEMEAYYASMGIQTVDPKGRTEVAHRPSVEEVLARNGGRYDVKLGRYVFTVDEEDADPVGDGGDISGAQALAAESQERALAVVTEDPDTEESNMGKAWQGFPKSGAPNSLLEDGYTDAQVEAIRIVHGDDVAEAYDTINLEMGVLDGKDALLLDLMSDMMNLTSEEGQETVISQLFSQLPNRLQEKLMTNGL